jgi:hypothetical protein
MGQVIPAIMMSGDITKFLVDSDYKPSVRIGRFAKPSSELTQLLYLSYRSSQAMPHSDIEAIFLEPKNGKKKPPNMHQIANTQVLKVAKLFRSILITFCQKLHVIAELVLDVLT